MEPPNLSTHIAGIHFSTPFWNASGVNCTTMKQLSEVVECYNISGVVTKSCTLQSREGNPSPRYHSYSNASSINSMGLPNHGLKYYMDAAKTLGHQKPIIISLAGLTLHENIKMMTEVQNDSVGVSGVELNLSCPNVPGKPQVAYDFTAMKDTLDSVFELWDNKIPLGVKLPPYFDPIHFQQAGDVLNEYPKLRWLTCINSIGNGLLIDPITETTLITPKGGLGGLGGGIVKATALANVRMFRNLMSDNVDIIGCGGIFRGVDIFEHILCGASSVQIGTYIQERKLDGVQRLRSELEYIMRVKGYQTLSDFRGKLKVAEESLAFSNDPSCPY